MRIGLLTASVSSAGGGVYEAVRRLAQEQVVLGTAEIQVFGVEDHWTESDLRLWNGVHVTVLDTWGPRSFGYAPGLIGSLDFLQPDIVHVQGLWMYPSLVGRRWAQRHARPYLVSPQGMLDGWALRNSALKKRLAGWLYENRNLREAACLHAVCEAEARAIRAYGLRNPTAVIPNGVDLPEDRPAADAPWVEAFPAGVKVLLFLGRLHRKKNASSLLHGWASVRKVAESAGWRLVVAGWDQGGHAAELQRLSRELGIAEAVWFAGPLFGESKDRALRRAAASVLPSLSEGLPVAVLEAWAYQLPVLMTPQCNLPEGFRAGAALPVEASPESIGRGLNALFGMTETERREMGERGRRLVAERFSWPRIAEQMKQVYEWVLGGGPRPECVGID